MGTPNLVSSKFGVQGSVLEWCHNKEFREHARCRLETTPLPKQPVGARYLLLGLTGRLKASGCLTRSNIQKSVGEWLGNVCEGMNSERKALRKDGA